MTNPTYRRARYSVTLLHAHLVFVTKYRRAVLTDAMLTSCQTTMHEVCDDLGAELVELNGEADHVHPLVAYPPTLAISMLLRRRTLVDHQAIHRRPSPTTMTTGLRPPTNGMGSTPD